MKSIEINEASGELIERIVSTGDFDSPVEVIESSLRLLDERNSKLAHLKELLQAGLDDIEAGRVGPLDMEDIIARAREEHFRGNSVD